MNTKRIKNNMPKILICDQEDNTIVDGYMTPAMLQAEIQAKGQIAVDYIEKVKAQMKEEDRLSNIEQMNNQEFQKQLEYASNVSKEKVEQIYEKRNTERKLKNAIENFKRKQQEYNEAYKKAELEYHKLRGDNYEKKFKKKNTQNKSNDL